MSYDVAIVNGLLVDGSGSPPRRADVAVKDGVICAVDDCPQWAQQAEQVIDAEGAIVTPGFVDLHCHYDGQVSWDSDLAPSCFHGVTTCVMGNCGVGFAPVREDHRQKLIELMEGVEDIPGAALAEGLRWRWESFPEYMSAIDDFPHAIDFVVQVTHDALRVYTMGERGAQGAPASAAEIAQMRSLLRAALDEGAVGFTTGRTDNHRTMRGQATPAADAAAEELCGIAEAFRGLDHGVIQAVSDFDMARGPQAFDPEFSLLERMAESAGRPLSISLSQRDMAPQQWRQILARAEAAAARGIALRVQVAPRPIGVLLGLDATFHPFIGFPSYKAISHLPLVERVRRMAEPAFKAQLLGERSEPVAGDGSPIPPLADALLARLNLLSLRLFRMGDPPDYAPPAADSLGAEAQRRGLPPLSLVYDVLLEQDGQQLLYFPLFNYTEFNLDAVHTMLTHPLALAGLGDGGAHVGTICDASFPTFFLTHWVRDSGRLPVERVIKMLACDPARYLGLRDRGLVAPGLRADLNVIDLSALQLRRPRLVRDLPAGGKRLLQDARGYRATLVRGQTITRDGQRTAALPGRLLRVGSGKT